ncbi:uncharacterized protein LMH87_007820 [Akanthomyces muscarius]|uniref:Uncharacterized protein n=1 Tax=Akanthomyces muscarius TaxID=2231603 RepID=A0A9W8UR14_AKAMU|nr:uncharacterized protein LMH87_007820 [Akanthomyces muscarius]KAJ4159883.1 hypothetical protein LMH87_007820 [Akanthomyces muscarius]
MKSTQLAVIITGVLSTVALGESVVRAAPAPVEMDGCRCDSHGTYLCDPSSLHKAGGQCVKCGCHAG